jgi:glycosyltransferase involved in cell wall biosynthesis
MIQDEAIQSEKTRIALPVISGLVRGENQLGTDLDSHGTVVIIPAYNEDRHIGSVVLKAHKFANHIIVVDDGSRDATAEIAKAAGAIVICHEENCGKGVALNTGFRHARELNPSVVVTLDADGQHIPEQIALVTAPVLKGQADIVVGSRYLEKKSRVPVERIWGHIAFNFFNSQLSGVPLTDSQSGFRAFSARAIHAISFNSNGFSVESEMQLLAQEHQLRMMEVPITILYDDPPKRSVIAHGLMVLTGILRLVGQYRPLLFFGVPGLLLLLIGLGGGGVALDMYQQAQIMALRYALVSVLFAMIGVVSLFAGIILHSVRGLLLDLVRPSLPQKAVAMSVAVTEASEPKQREVGEALV